MLGKDSVLEQIRIPERQALQVQVFCSQEFLWATTDTNERVNTPTRGCDYATDAFKFNTYQSLVAPNI